MFIAGMQTLRFFTISPAIPGKISLLETLARNLWWSWNPDAIELFRRIDRELWKDSRANPILFLSRVSQDQLTALITDESFMSHLERVRQVFAKETQQPPDTRSPVYLPGDCIAYFCAEFGGARTLNGPSKN